MPITRLLVIAGTALSLSTAAAAPVNEGIAPRLDAISVVPTARIDLTGLHTLPSAEETDPGTAPASTVPDGEVWQVGSLDHHVLNLALQARSCAASSGAAGPSGPLIVIDYSKPSTVPRLWVIDVERRTMLYEELVAHGRGTGDDLAVRFSNTPESHQSSLGLFVTEEAYVGQNGYSLRLNGLDSGFNDRARERAIVMHGAPYVNARVTKTLGRLGRSFGCPAVREPVARELIDRVKGGSLVFAYYPDPRWLASSIFLGGCPSAS